MGTRSRPAAIVRASALVLAVLLAVLLVVAAAALWWAGQTTSFLRFSLQQAAEASDGAFQADGVRGTLLGGFRIDSVRWRDAQREVELRDLTVAWRADRLLRRQLRISRVEIAQVSVKLSEGTGEPPSLPESLRLPMRVRVDALGIGRLTIAAGDGEPVVLERVAFSGRHGAGRYRVVHLGATSPQWGEATLRGTLGDQPPYALQVDGVAMPRIDGGRALPRVQVLADGTLGQFSLVAQALSPSPAAVSGDAQAPRPVWIGIDTDVRPFAQDSSERLSPIAIAFDSVEPGQLGFVDAPLARLSGSANVRLGPQGITGELDLRNALAGAIDRNAVPLQRLQASFAWSQRRLVLHSIDAALPQGAAVRGTASVDFARDLVLFGRDSPAVQAGLAVDGVDLSQIATTLQPTRLRGDVRVEDSAFEVALADSSRADIGLNAQGRVDGDVLQVERARMRTGAGMLDASGSATTASPYRIEFDGRFTDLDPAGALQLAQTLVARGPPGGGDARGGALGLDPALLERLNGRLTGSWSARGQAWPELRLQTRLAVERGTLDGEPLRLAWRGTVTPERVADAVVDLASGDLRLRADGSLGRADDRMRFSATAGSLRRFEARASGSLRAAGELHGGWRDAGIGVVADVSGQDLQWADAGRIGSVAGRIDLPELDRGRIGIDIVARSLQWEERVADRLQLRVDGSIDAHTLRFEVAGPGFAGRASAHGGLERPPGADWRWQGEVETLVAETPLAAQLHGAMPLRIGAQGVLAGPATLDVDGATVRIGALTLRDGAIDTRGEIEALPLGRWVERFTRADAIRNAEAQLADVELGAQWNLNGTSVSDLSGNVSLRLVAGEAGEAGGRADVVLDRGRLDGKVDLRIPTLAFANRSIGPEWAVAGRLRFSGTVAGTIESPMLHGDLVGRDMALLQHALGWRFTGGTLNARFDGERLEVQQLRLESGGGSIMMSGELLLDPMQGEFQLRADRLPVPIGPGERVVVSGDTVVTSRGTALEWKGRIRADEGSIELRGGDAPRLPDDVVILGRETSEDVDDAAQPADDDARGFGVVADLELDLGRRLRVHGSGLDVLLEGSLQLRGNVPSEPRAYGTVSVREGTYTAYGRELEITRGRVIFDGPLDNPVLDIVAMRLGQPVQAGVALTGTVLSPRTRLVSDPEVPDVEKLSWLVLGVGSEDAGSAAQLAALRAAAATILGSGNGGSSGGLTRALGLDVLTLRSASAGGVFDPDFGATFPGQASTAGVPTGATQSVVAIGKRLSSRVLVTYEQGLRGVWSLLRVQYDITERLSVRAQAGTDTALDLLYSFFFD